MRLRTGVIKKITVVGPAPPFVAPLELLPVAKDGKTNWCWASCVAMALRFLQPEQVAHLNDKQLLCRIAERSAVGNGRCCEPNPLTCDSRLLSEAITALWETFGIKPLFLDEDHKPKISRLVEEIDQNRLPVEIKLTDGGTAHVVILFGCVKANDGTQIFLYRNPDNPDPSATLRLSELDLTTGGAGSTWTHTWLDLRPH
jgi:hypothetical protein